MYVNELLICTRPKIFVLTFSEVGQNKQQVLNLSQKGIYGTVP